MIRICVIVFAAWIVISVPTVVLFGVLVRAGRRQSRTPLIIAGDGTVGSGHLLGSQCRWSRSAARCAPRTSRVVDSRTVRSPCARHPPWMSHPGP